MWVFLTGGKCDFGSPQSVLAQDISVQGAWKQQTRDTPLGVFRVRQCYRRCRGKELFGIRFDEHPRRLLSGYHVPRLARGAEAHIQPC